MRVGPGISVKNENMSGSCLDVASVCIDKDNESAAVKLLLYGLE